MRPRPVVVSILVAVAPCAAHAQPTVADSYARARALLDAAVAAHGGVGALRAARQAHVVLEGHDVHRNQSRRVAPPYDRAPHRVDLAVDLARGRLRFARTSAYPGGIPRATAFVSDGDRHWFVDRRTGTHTAQQWPAAASQWGSLFHLPQHVLLAARESPAPLRALGPLRLASGAVVDAVAAAIPNGTITLGFDPATRLLRAVLGVRADPLAGDAATETELVDYRPLGGLLLPTRRVVRVAGEVTQDLAYVAAVAGYAMPDSLAAPPAGSTLVTPPPPAEPVRALAPGVWTVGAPGAAALVVAFRDHLLVVDAPAAGSAETLARLAALAPGKPVRYAIPTHHHDDHAGGVRPYAAAGATLVTTPGNVAYLARMAAARATLAGDTLGAVTPRVETLTGARTFTDGARTVEIHDVGPGPHAEEMLVAWLPAEGILFQGDLVDVGADGVVRPGTHNATTAHFAAWLAARGWRVRTLAGTHGTLAAPGALAEILRQPLPPAAASAAWP